MDSANPDDAGNLQIEEEINSASSKNAEARIKWTEQMEKDVVVYAAKHQVHLSTAGLTKMQKWTNVATELWKLPHFIAALREPLKHQALKNKFKKLQSAVKAKAGVDNQHSNLSGNAEMSETESTLLAMAKEEEDAEEKAKLKKDTEQARKDNLLRQECAVQARNGVKIVHDDGTGELENAGDVDELGAEGSFTSTDEKSITSKGAFSSAALNPLDSVFKRLEESFSGTSSNTSTEMSAWEVEERRRRLEMEEEDRKVEREEKRARLAMEERKLEMEMRRESSMMNLFQTLAALHGGPATANAAPVSSGAATANASPHRENRANESSDN